MTLPSINPTAIAPDFIDSTIYDVFRSLFLILLLNNMMSH